MSEFIVITRTTLDPEFFDSVVELAKRSLPIFEKQKGLEMIQFLASHNKKETCTYMIWDSKEDHEACMTSTDFEPINDEWRKMIEKGVIRFDLQTYEELD